MTVEETSVPVLALLITDTTQTLLILSVGHHFEKAE
jgi:hypothetical protein